MADGFRVGPGIDQAMQEEGDTAASDEVDDIGGQARFAYGMSGIRYVFLVATGQVYKFRPRP